MATQAAPRDQRVEEEPSAWAVGWTFFAGTMMALMGGWWIFAGLIALFNDEFYVATSEWVFKFDATTWGWIHLLIGLVVLAAGFAVFTGAIWARTIGVIIAVLAALAAFAWLPWYPVWGAVLIAVAVAVIWALTAHGRDVTRQYDYEY